jgi:hypothetical protein
LHGALQFLISKPVLKRSMLERKTGPTKMVHDPVLQDVGHADLPAIE